MAEVPEKRKPGPRRRSRASQPRKSSQSRVCLEQVFGLTASGSSLSSSSGLVAYPAGCVVVLLDPNTNKQSHILNSSRKSFSALSFSHNGKLLVTGESGHLPCVRVFDLEGALKAEVQTHKYGVSCVAFSRSDLYVVSVGFQHDMNVIVWDWKKGVVIASNKVSSRVSSVSFSDDGSFFVTAGTRHLKFWYLHESARDRVNSTVPLIGRSALLGDHKNSVFVAAACGRGSAAARTFCITSSALLCVFNARRTLEAWVHLKAVSAFALVAVEDMVFCGCSNGIVRVFSPSLSHICTLQRPHRLGVELQLSASPGAGAVFPDAVALSFDLSTRFLCIVYSDHSLYCHDLRDQRNPSKTYSALYHSSCVWGLEVYPDVEDCDSCLPPGAFVTSSSDGTIRVWSTESPHSNRYSQDLLRILYVGDSDSTDAGADGKSGLRVLALSPDGIHLVTGDRHGNLSVFGLEFIEELQKIEAHNSEVLCLQFSPESSGVRLLASSSRDRLIHIYNRDQNYDLIQCLWDHSGSVTALRFSGAGPELRMVSCGADKSIYIQTAEQTEAGLVFSRCHHVVEKSSLYDMDLDSTRTQAAFACQDRNIRVYGVDSGKLMKTLKGSWSDEGALLKVTFDPSGSFIASSSSDKSICIHDYESGECVATLSGHSEIVTSIRFSSDFRHLLTASGDSCIFVWRLDSSMTSLMRKRRGLDRKRERNRKHNIRRETFITGPSNQMSLLTEGEESEVMTPGRHHTENEVPLLQTNGKMPLWFRKLQREGGTPSSLDQSEAEPLQVRRRWAEQINPRKIFSPSPTQDQNLDLEEEFCPQSLESLLLECEGEEPPGVICSSFGVFPDHSDSCRDFNVQGRQEVESQEDLSPESTCSDDTADTDCESLSASSSQSSLGFGLDSALSSALVSGLDSGSDLILDQNPLQKNFQSLDPNVSMAEERFNTDPTTLESPDLMHFRQPRLSLSTRFLSKYQDRCKSQSSRILEEISTENMQPQTMVSCEDGSRSGPRPGSSLQDCKLGDNNLSSLPPPGLLGNAVPLGRSQDLKAPNPKQELWDRGKENLSPTSQPGPGCGAAQDSVAPPPEPSISASVQSVEQEVEHEEVDDVTSCPAPECDRPRPSPGEQEVMRAAQKLRQMTEETISLYRQVASHSSLAAVLLEAFEDLRFRISSVCGSSPSAPQSAPCSPRSAPQSAPSDPQSAPQSAPCDPQSAPCGPLEHCSGAVALLERYSDLLLQMTRNKVNQRH